MPSWCFRRIAIALALHADAGLWAACSAAAPADPQLQAARQQFAQAEQDEDAGRWQDALAKLRDVLAVKQTAGVRYHIALCEEHIGQLVAALADYRAADGEAHSENAEDVLRLVGKRLADLDPRVPRLTVHVVSDVPDATLTLDGVAVGRALFGTAMPVDPGNHRVEASAQDRTPSSVEVTMHERDSTVLDVKLVPVATPGPALVREPGPAAAPGRESAGFNRSAALIETITALVLAGGGVGAYVAAGNAHGAAVSGCSRIVSAAPDACDTQKRAVRAWDWTAAGAWAGAAAASTLALLSWTKSPHPTSAAASIHIAVGPDWLGLDGDF